MSSDYDGGTYLTRRSAHEKALPKLENQKKECETGKIFTKCLECFTYMAENPNKPAQSYHTYITDDMVQRSKRNQKGLNKEQILKKHKAGLVRNGYTVFSITQVKGTHKLKGAFYYWVIHYWSDTSE